MRKTVLACLCSGFFLLTTCRDIESVTPNRDPVAVAGNDATSIIGPVDLDGSRSSDPDGDRLFYQWRILEHPDGSQASIQPFDSARSVFMPDLPGLYSIKLVVTDNIASSADTINIEVSQGNGGPNDPPIADAGKDATVNLGETFTLNGSGSDPDGDDLTSEWTLTTKPAGSNAVIQGTSFIADRPGSYVATLTVSDGEFSDTDDVTIVTNVVQITGIDPTSGPFGLTVKITGVNFSNVPSENQVVFGKVGASNVSSASYTELNVEVPKGADTGTVFVTVNSVTASGPIFTYVPSAVVSSIAQFDSPYAMVSDSQGNLYIADYNSHIIRKMTPGGTVTTVAGTGVAGYTDAKLNQSQFNHPTGIAYDQQNQALYVADNSNHCIRKVDLLAGVVSTFAGFPQAGFNDATGQQAQFSSPIGLARDLAGNLYVGDFGNNRIRKITTGAVVTTYSGSGTAGFADGSSKAARFNGIAGVAVDDSGNVYVADALNNRVRKIVAGGTASTLAGDGQTSTLNIPYAVACDQAGYVYVADFGNNRIRGIAADGTMTTIAGGGANGSYVDGPGSQAKFNNPIGVATAPGNLIYVADFANQRIRKIQFE